MKLYQLVTLAALGTASVCLAQTTGIQCVADQTLYQQSNVNGAQGPIASAGSLLAFTSGSDTLSLLDASDPTNPVLISQTPGLITNDAFGPSFAMNSTIAATARFNEIRIIDISDPANPSIASSIPTSGFDDIWISGSRLISYTGSGFEIYDVSDPANPTQLGSLTLAFNAYTIAISGNTLCVTEQGVGLTLFDISDPGNITQEGFLANSNLRPGAIAKDGLLVLMQTGSQAFLVDISDPANPAEISNSGDEILGLAEAEFVGDYLAASRDVYSGVDIYDVSNPASVQHYRSIEGPDVLGHQRLTALGSDLAMISVGGLTIYPLDQVGPVTSVMYNDSPAGIASDALLTGMFVDGQVGFSADIQNDELFVFDLSDPNSPAVLATLDVGAFSPDQPRHARPIAYADDVVYLSIDGLEIQAIDVSDPMNPVLLSTFDGWDTNLASSGTTASLDAADGYLYVNPNFGPMTIFDVSTPASPVPVHTTGAPLSQYNNGVAASGNRLVSFSQSDGPGTDYSFIHVFDISVPTQPVQLQNNSTSGFFGPLPRDYRGGFAFDGDTILISVGDSNFSLDRFVGGMISLDLSDDVELLDQIVFEPMENSFTDGGGVGQIMIDGDTAYTTGQYYKGLSVFDVSDPTNLVYVGTSGARSPIAGSYTTLVGSKIYGASANLVGVFDASTSCAGSCPADLTGDGVLDFFDVSMFLSAFNTQDPVADFTGDGIWDFFDVSAFLGAYNAGCP